MPEIAVIGCGVIGLTSAIAIQEKCKNAKITIYTKAVSPDTTSDIAAGLWEPYLLQNTPAEDVFKWSMATYEYLIRLWREGKASDAGICLQPVTYAIDNPKYTFPEWLKPTLGYVELSQQQLENLGTRYGVEFTGGFIFNSFTWEGASLLPYLQNEFIKKGGKIVKRKINNLKELSDNDVIVNCTGLEARELLGDNLLKPIRGQIMKVSAPWVFHSYLFDSEKSGYILANKNFTVLGGTRQVDYSTEFNQTDANNIVRNCTEILPAITSAKLIKHQVGLRPARNAVRLEVEIKDIGHKHLKVVHNYGHGGAGITLSVGCAKDAAELVEGLLKYNGKNKL